MSLAARLWGQDSQKRDSSEVTDEINIIIRDIAKHSDLVKILLFGSFATGQATSSSDLDIAVILPDHIDKKAFRKAFYQTRTRIQIPVDFIFRSEIEFMNSNGENPVDEEIHQKCIEIYPKMRSCL